MVHVGDSKERGEDNDVRVVTGDAIGNASVWRKSLMAAVAKLDALKGQKTIVRIGIGAVLFEVVIRLTPGVAD